MIGGLRITFSDHALAATDERLFPASRHRSARIRKKLLKRHGGEFRQQPCMWRVGSEIIAHPSFKAEIERQFADDTARAMSNATARIFRS